MENPPQESEDLYLQYLEELEKIELGVLKDPPSKNPDTAPLQSEQKFSIEKQRQDLELQDFSHQVKARRIYGYLAFGLVLAWLVVVLATVWLSAVEFKFASKGWTIESIEFDVSDAVLIALVTTTTINLLGLLVIVFNHLFPSTKA
jgi:hypothetical protein